MKWIAAFALALGLATPVSAQTEAASEARTAIALLDQATTRMEEADGALDRVKALTETIKAFEAGLAAMRTGLRQAAILEARLTAKLQSRNTEIAQLLAILQGITPQDSPTILLHPQGPTGTARAGMLLAELTPTLNARADQLRRDLQDVQSLRLLQSDAADRLQMSLSKVQAARAALNQAIADRTDLPTRFTADSTKVAILIASSETLDGFASGLSEVVTSENADVPLPPSINAAKGGLPMPVRGLTLRGMNEADAAGITRPGLLIATRPFAIVTAPVGATIRYVGPLLDFGNVVILEPQSDMLMVLAGLETVYGKAGQVIAADTPLGLMGGANAAGSRENSQPGEGAGNGRTETLYMEVRVNNVPQDPDDWFLTDKDG